MIPLPTLERVPDVMRNYGTDAVPLRPSRLASILGCSMGVVLSHANEGIGNGAAQTGNLAHEAIRAMHCEKGGDPVAAGLAALERARAQFPEGDQKKADRIFRAYAADEENLAAPVIWCEQAVRLTLAPDASDPTGQPVVIAGTLDQIRRHPGGKKRVWDVKTGDRLAAEETVTEYVIQQAAYVLAARESLDPEVEPGGIIYTPAYLKNRGRRFIPLEITVEDCTVLMSALVASVALIRRGVPAFKPSVENCAWCPHKPYPHCLKALTGFYGRMK